MIVHDVVPGWLREALLLDLGCAGQAEVVDEDVRELGGRVELAAATAAVDGAWVLEQLLKILEVFITELLFVLVEGSMEPRSGVAAVRLAAERSMAAGGTTPPEID